MKIAHLTEMEVQLYITEPQSIGKELKAHVEVCMACQTRSANYAMLINSIQESVKPTFNFDLSSMVMERLPAPKRSFPWASIIISFLSVALIAIIAILFGSAMISLINGVSGVILIAMAGGAVAFAAFQAFEIVREYERRMDFVVGQNRLQL